MYIIILNMSGISNLSESFRKDIVNLSRDTFVSMLKGFVAKWKNIYQFSIREIWNASNQVNNAVKKDFSQVSKRSTAQEEVIRGFRFQKTTVKIKGDYYYY